ncbi:hypothetical protein E4T66_07210 [Sinimarinibacterium sp. CAU 1509]|uniref:hypothetical protein n=1 Tax=Sinimarinibacterium sp. CAU 1509 TaxID=2562283 RepID=UPI0010AD1038|nr:hypothetical protein [Sinimarinibacterium sp. CAU 1509]TJY62020.1 hypothetical protein E4T66_07210 [Sinimarinibacterium sp. CAU 1509]
MNQPKTLLLSVFSGGGGTARYGDFVVVRLSAGAFAASSQEFNMTQNWARARVSSGNAQRDRSTFTDHFETLLARSGCGIATKGSRPLLKRIVEGLKQMNIDLSEWSIPANINESVEVQRRTPATDRTVVATPSTPEKPTP